MRHLRVLRRTTALLALTTVSAVALPQIALSETVLRIGMTAADIPRTLGQPDQGFEGNRFTGLTMYDGLTMWDLSSATKASVVIPGLATEWKVEDADKTKWIFKLRPGVTFHDGTPFNADAVVWNVDKVLNKEAPQFDASQVGVTASRMPTLVSAKKIDDMTVELSTKEPDSFLPINLTNLFMVSPSKWQVFYERAEGADAKAKSQAAWAAFAKDAAGTGPWKMAKFTPRERLELVKNENYWDKARVPKTDRMVLLPMPEANARTAALLAGQVDWVEAPAPDAVKEIEGRGFKIEKNEQPHVWPWQFSRIEGSPWNDIRVRKAANLCIDREGLRDGLLAGLMVPATGTFEPGHPWRGNPSFQIKYDLPAAQKLMKEAGFGPSKKLSVKIQTSASGSGQMLPLPMNEYLQQALAECYFDVKLDVIEWNTLFTNWRRGVKDPSANGSDAVNITYAAMDPFFALVRFLQSSMAPPVSNNWGFINNPKFDELVKKARTSFDEKERDKALAELNAASIDDAAFLYVAHDVGPRALSPKIKGFVQPKSWFVDFSPVSISQ
ncbi:ABC transporter substrate-binding protein [Rhodopseudomonas telluris]|uniref:ABC transporter substrate-binding protein n=1 Tax=Rhodopseudomonas telluris TaxID=644215 RepID=A0ABV6ES36_9BRAD